MSRWPAPLRFLASLLAILSPVLLMFLFVQLLSPEPKKPAATSSNTKVVCPSGKTSQECKQLQAQRQQPPLEQPPASAELVPYSQFINMQQAHQIQQALIDQQNNRLWFASNKKTLATPVPQQGITSISEQLAQSGVVVRIMPDRPQGGGNNWILYSLAIFIVVGLLFSFFMRRMFRAMPDSFEGGFGGDKPKNKTAVSMVKFSDVAGCDEVVEEVQEFVQFLRHPENFRATGARMPSGLILHGPPGTGKTLVAKAMAGEAGVPFFAVSGSDFVEKYVGVGASRIRDLFRDARKSPGAVIFIDEVDAIGRRRGDESHPERDQSLNALLTEMDGFEPNNRVVVIAATNRLDVIDPALLRPGRFARQVRVGLPDQQGRLEILEIYARSKPLADEVDLEDLARTTAGCSGADLEDMLNEAAIMAARESCDQIHTRHVIEGQLRALAGPAKRNNMSPEEREMVAYHEAGHVLTAELCQEHEKAQRASIRPRGQAGGLALYGQQDRALHSAQYLHEKIVCALGGRAAEWVQYGVVSSGAANDLQQATAIARQSVEELGLSSKAGQAITSHSGRNLAVSDATRKIVDEEVDRMVAQAYGEAVRLLEGNQPALERLAQALLDGEEIDRLEIVQAIQSQGEEIQPATRKPQGMSPRTDSSPVEEASPAKPAPAAPRAKEWAWSYAQRVLGRRRKSPGSF